eukprot:gnl/TRDRNA2_/TRDRNA2_100261_c0_seq1.p1 gnl/TRDRNA2_/TRDRNA2_100261_c0~~gnl/TRDRNA2_/TRDRNA2_100261_c0_seq1.p1  ORF type:complete len:122 (+),score=18.03 gnl/TRDRNA2_/TRDRNA2_100261_c0_seq1:430-795(+)
MMLKWTSSEGTDIECHDLLFHRLVNIQSSPKLITLLPLVTIGMLPQGAYSICRCIVDANVGLDWSYLGSLQHSKIPMYCGRAPPKLALVQARVSALVSSFFLLVILRCTEVEQAIIFSSIR